MRQFVRLSGVIAMSLTLVGGLTACGGMFSTDKAPTEAEILSSQQGRTLWESGFQYVKIVDRDAAGIANEHPAVLSSDELRTVLSSIYVNERIGLKKVDNPVFSSSELAILSPAIASGLSQAQSNEDINFVSIGVHPSTLAKEPKTNTGRLFISGGRLNIIFGKLHELYRDKDLATGQNIDRRINPLKPGSRRFETNNLSAPISLDKGQALYIDPNTGKEREDWIVIDIATVLEESKISKKGNSGTVTPELLDDIMQIKQATGNLNDDVSNIKEILFEMSGEIDKLKKEINTLKQK